MICEQTAQEGQNKEHGRICSGSTVQINLDDTTMVWREGGHTICCTRSEWQVQLFVSECYRFLTPPKKVKASPHNALIPCRGCCMENGRLSSKSVLPDLFPTIMSSVVSILFLLLSVLPPSHASWKSAFLPPKYCFLFPYNPSLSSLQTLALFPSLAKGAVFSFSLLSPKEPKLMDYVGSSW